MIDIYLKDLEEMSNRKADFTEYYHKLLNAMNDLKDNQKAIFVYVLMNAIRDIGYENGKKDANEFMIKFLTSKP